MKLHIKSHGSYRPAARAMRFLSASVLPAVRLAFGVRPSRGFALPDILQSRLLRSGLAFRPPPPLHMITPRTTIKLVTEHSGSLENALVLRVGVKRLSPMHGCAVLPEPPPDTKPRVSSLLGRRSYAQSAY